ncbi:sugar ABC transporter permease [Saccharospirillum sp. MSK14-1]|uniref:carbohydrate ABC transporter permease n=1 Tax=Saccharospirillum sp. MSK14-1 TaxID=1897632 RepID=UPI000D376B7C|nr:carbohydrate ABC transporter permease [Saccharospirillum sp. MSK14-1]PTY37620.1 sugar ABC transporter permease [Saccharospirillum sp. MSK14-1]
MNHWLRNPWIGRGLIVLLMAITLLPFLSMLSAALAPSGTYPVGLSWPSDPQWGNFARAFEVANMGQMMLSSLLIVAGVVPLAVIMACLAGFGLSKLVTGRRKWLYLVFVLGLTLPFESIITPLYYEVRALGLLNTRFAIILPLLGLYMPFSVYWMRAHFIGVPKDLSEAAQLDGADSWREFWKIQMPLARPSVMSLSILLFLWTWNQFLLPVVLVQDPTKRTVAGALGAFQGQWGTDVPLLCAGSLIILAPTVILFLIFQRQFVSALLQGAVKG